MSMMISSVFSVGYPSNSLFVVVSSPKDIKLGRDNGGGNGGDNGGDNGGGNEGVQVERICKATGAWTGDAATDTWCTTNCFQNPPFCPTNICICQEQETRTRCIAAGETL